MVDVEVPGFTWIFALLIVLVFAGVVSFLKPKQDYKPFEIGQFDSCNTFCLARVQWWTVRFIFYYVQPMVAGPLFLITIILISILSAIRLDDEFHGQIKFVEFYNNGNDSECKDLNDLLDSTRGWSDQLTWMLIIYFFQKLFGATLFLNGGGLATIASMIFDPWLYISSIWGVALFYNIIYVSENIDDSQCFQVITQKELNKIEDALNTIIEDLNAFCIILWILCALSLPFGILIDYLCSVIKEWKYGVGKAGSPEAKLESQQEYNQEVR